MHLEQQTAMVLFDLRQKLIPSLMLVPVFCGGMVNLPLLGVQSVRADNKSAQISQPNLYQTQGVIFESPPGFSALKPLGGNTMGIVLPSTTQAKPISVRLAELQPDTLGMDSLKPHEFAEYARFTFFGITTAPTQHITRRFLGQNIAGDVLFQTNNGRTTYIEFYVVPLTLNRQLAIAFEADTELPVELLEQTIQTVSASLREDPTLKTKKKPHPPLSSRNFLSLEALSL
jgi:hypothetical protein